MSGKAGAEGTKAAGTDPDASTILETDSMAINRQPLDVGRIVFQGDPVQTAGTGTLQESRISPTDAENDARWQ